MSAAHKSECPAATGHNANENTDATILLTAEKIGNSHQAGFNALRARYALIGRTLTRSHRVPDGLISYAVTRGSIAHYFHDLHGVQAHLAQVEARQ